MVATVSDASKPVSVDEMIKRLEAEFLDTLDREVAEAGIYISYAKGFGENQRVVRELGIPYFIIKKPEQQPILLVGPYIESSETSRLRDYYARTVSIPVERIVNFRKIRLNDPKIVVDLRK